MVSPRQGHQPPQRPVLEAYKAVAGATYTAKAGDRVIGVNRAGAVTVTLPTAEVRPGRVFTVKDESGAAATNNITVATEGSENIDGSATDVINVNYESKSYYSDGNNWFILPIQATQTHASAHASGGADAIKLDDLSAPDDNTDLDVSTTKHGLVPKGTNVGNFLKDDASWAAPGGLTKTTKANGSTSVNANTRANVNTYVATDAVHTHLYDARRDTGTAGVAQSGALVEGDESVIATAVATISRHTDGTTDDQIILINGEGSAETFDWQVFLIA